MSDDVKSDSGSNEDRGESIEILGRAEIVEPGDGGLDPDIAAEFGNVVVPRTGA